MLEHQVSTSDRAPLEECSSIALMKLRDGSVGGMGISPSMISSNMSCSLLDSAVEFDRH